jgi:hypothetical protein
MQEGQDFHTKIKRNPRETAVLNADESQLQEPALLAAGRAAQGLVDASPAG